MVDEKEKVQDQCDHTSDERFTNYYTNQSQSDQTWSRCCSIRDSILRIFSREREVLGILDITDIGCCAGTMCMTWAEQGHRVHGLDINEPLLELGKKRAAKDGYEIDFQLGSAVDLPWQDKSMDVCIALELLEHVEDWQACMREFSRVLRPHGVLCVTTTNVLCPKQNEFNLPFYSWYPKALKKYFVKQAMTNKPQLANYAKYPAFNWFSFFSLRQFLSPMGFRCMDRFDVTDASEKGNMGRWALFWIRHLSLLRLLAHTTFSGTVIFALKDSESGHADDLPE